MRCYTYMNALITFFGNFNHLTDDRTTLYVHILLRALFMMERFTACALYSRKVEECAP